MKKRILIVAYFALALGLVVVPAYGQTAADHATIPFSFVVLERTLPAGAYTIIAAPHELKIRDANQRLVAVVLANEMAGPFTGANAQVIFHCYADRCFLAELRSSTQGGRKLIISKAEAAAAREETPKYFAILGDRPRK